MRPLALLALVPLIAGCSSGVDETNASVEEVAAAIERSGEAVKLRPGRWETRGELVELTAPGLPPQAQEMMRTQLAGAINRVAICLKPEDVDRPDAGFFGQPGKDCRFDHYRMAGGKIDARMRCAPPGPSGGPAMEMVMSGTYASTSYAMDLSSTMRGMGDQPMTMRMRMTSARAGDCKGDEISAGSAG